MPRRHHLLGLAVAAALLALPALAAPTSGSGPSPARRMTSELARLGEAAQVAVEHGFATVTVPRITPADAPRLRVDAAVAAARTQRACGCLTRYAVADDRRVLVSPREIDAADDGRGDGDETVWALDGASDRAVGRRAQEIVDHALPTGAARLSFAIRRDGRLVAAFAYRPATQEWSWWAAAGIATPRPPAPVARVGPQTPFSGN